MAGRCGSCGSVSFPPAARCSCGGTVQNELLPPEGTLWTWTTQGFEPKPPYLPDGEFEPYAVGYVEFPGHLRVEGRLTESSPDRLRIGMRMRVVSLDRGGQTTYAFSAV